MAYLAVVVRIIFGAALAFPLPMFAIARVQGLDLSIAWFLAAIGPCIVGTFVALGKPMGLKSALALVHNPRASIKQTG